MVGITSENFLILFSPLLYTFIIILLIEKINVPLEGMNLLRSILGRYTGMGPRSKFQRSGEIGIPVNVGTTMNVVSSNNYIEFEYINYFSE